LNLLIFEQSSDAVSEGSRSLLILKAAESYSLSLGILVRSHSTQKECTFFSESQLVLVFLPALRVFSIGNKFFYPDFV
jgi:hypothetical protein